jgi:glycosyltransferase involved in cell wall biosynthesis
MRYLRRTGIGDRVILHRRMLTIDELVREYSTARAAVVPSFFEGFGFPASEAMSCGLPVIANAAGALPEVVGSDGSAGPARSAARPGGDGRGDPRRARRAGPRRGDGTRRARAR